MLSLKCVNCFDSKEKNEDLLELQESVTKLLNIQEKKTKINFLTSVIEERQVFIIFLLYYRLILTPNLIPGVT